MNEIPVSVVVPAYNCERTIAKTLQAIKDQTLSSPIEIIVVDDGSTDRTAEIVRTFEGVRYIQQPNSGPATARNCGAQEATNVFVCFTDSDCEPQPDWLEQLTRPLSDPAISVVAGSYGISNPGSALARGIHQEIRFRHQKLMPDYPKSFGSYNFGIKKEAFEKVGGFDTGYRFASGEDNDLSYKLLKNGYKIFFARNALVNHNHPTSVTKYLKEQFRHGFWRVKMYRDHPDMMRGDDYTFWKDLVEVLLVTLILVNGVGMVFMPVFAQTALLFSLLTLFLLESAFSLRFGLPLFEALGFGVVMMMRSFGRTFGLLSGICENFFTTPQKK